MTCVFHLTVDWRNRYILVLFSGGERGGLRVGSFLSGFISGHNFLTLRLGVASFGGSLLSVVYDS